MKFYKQMKPDTDILVCLGILDGEKVPDNCTDITKDEYEKLMVEEQEKTAKLQAEWAEKQREEEAARQKAIDDHNAEVKSYVDAIKTGTKKIDDVPGTLRQEVNNIVNPPKTQAELIAELTAQNEAIQSAIDFLMSTAVGDIGSDDTSADTSADTNEAFSSTSTSESTSVSTSEPQSASASTASATSETATV
jgi:phage gp36-like protein